MATWFPEPDHIRRSPDSRAARHGSAHRDGFLSILTLINSLLHKRVLENRPRRILEPGKSDAQQASSRANASYRNRTEDSRPHELQMPGRPNAAPVVFWQALNPVERDAFRSFAISRTFAAGARLIQEGDQADHVMVILSGRTRICVEKNGKERLVAVRGPGQLVGERGVLQVRARSASVIAVDTVQALVARSRDFAAFITDHPRVLSIVEQQVHDRRTEDPGGYGSGAFHEVPAGRPARRPLNGENCTVLLSDVIGFGADWRTDEDRRVIREALFSMTHTVLQDLPDVWSWDDRGDGLLTVIPPSVPTGKVIAHLHKELPAALEEHNRVYPDSARIQLRVAINVGPVASDVMGVSGEAIIITARLVEAPVFKTAMSESGASLGIIASTFIYESVIRHGPYLEGYSEVPVDVKESSLLAWMKLFDRPLSSAGDDA
jgi:Cyclic nucleotide-binding domain